MTDMQMLMGDSAVARSPAMMKNMQELQRHMAAMLTTMAPMIGTMQQMQQHMRMAPLVKQPSPRWGRAVPQPVPPRDLNAELLPDPVAMVGQRNGRRYEASGISVADG